MRASPNHRAAAAATRTLGIALCVAAVVVAAGWGVQRAALRPPTDAELAVARIEGALLRYRFVRSEVHVPGEPVRRAVCLEGWQKRQPRRPAGRGARVAFDDGERLLLGDRRIARLARAATPTRLPPVAEVQLAGCPRALTNHIYGHLVSLRRTQAHPARFAGRAAVAVRIKTRRTRFALFVDPRTLAPIGMRVRSRGITAWSTLQTARLTPAVKQEFLRRFDG